MANTKLYLHEVIHIVGTGSEAYKRHTGERRTRGSAGTLVGTWQQSGSTGAWPRVVNLWEMGGWEHWGEILEYQYGRRGAQPPALRRWWTAAAKLRSGGFDRILEPAPYSPTRDELIASNVRGMAFIQEIATVVPGRADDYLDAVGREWLPVATRRGLVLIGAWRTAMRDTEAVVLWGFPTLRDYTRHLAEYRTAAETRHWAERARTWRTDYRETLLVPSPWCVVHPDWQPERRSAAAARGGAHSGRRSR